MVAATGQDPADRQATSHPLQAVSFGGKDPVSGWRSAGRSSRRSRFVREDASHNIVEFVQVCAGTTVTTIPSLTASDTDGAAMKAQLGQSATVVVKASNYAYFDGTSMATPHVSAVAALVWSYFPTCTGAQIRTSLNNSALDLGTAGRDTKYGYGLVQAKAAYDRIKALGCGK